MRPAALASSHLSASSFTASAKGHLHLSSSEPPGSLGYVNVPAAVLMGVVTAGVAPYGARLAHRMDRKALRRAFAIFLTLTAISIAAKTVT